MAERRSFESMLPDTRVVTVPLLNAISLVLCSIKRMRLMFVRMPRPLRPSSLTLAHQDAFAPGFALSKYLIGINTVFLCQSQDRGLRLD